MFVLLILLAVLPRPPVRKTLETINKNGDWFMKLIVNFLYHKSRLPVSGVRQTYGTSINIVNNYSVNITSVSIQTCTVLFASNRITRNQLPFGVFCDHLITFI